MTGNSSDTGRSTLLAVGPLLGQSRRWGLRQAGPQLSRYRPSARTGRQRLIVRIQPITKLGTATCGP